MIEAYEARYDLLTYDRMKALKLNIQKILLLDLKLNAYPTEWSHYLQEVQTQADKIVDRFVCLFFLLGWLMAPIFDTWALACILGSFNLLLYVIARYRLKTSYLSRMLVSVVFSLFTLQFIGQMQGMAEIHFVFFTNMAILIIYQDWRVMIPYTVLVLLHHTLFFYFTEMGMEHLRVYFISYSEVNSLVLSFHFSGVLMMALVCAWWSVIFRNNRMDLIIKEKIAWEQNEKLKVTQAEIEANLDVLMKTKTVLQYKNDQLREQHDQILIFNEKLRSANNNITLKSQELIEAYESLNNQNNKINESLRYAKRIQSAILPDAKEMAQVTPEHFVLYKPKDTVSGDFYWCAPLHKPGEHQSIVAAADCTGHGVPGALMSMIGESLLNQIIHDLKIHEPQLILEELDQRIRHTLKQDQTKGREGMDISICKIDHAQQTLEYAGARSPLVYVQNGELHFIKGNRVSIGGAEPIHQEAFTQHRLDISQPTTIYLFSDGYTDQFGGPKARKFLIRRFRQLLHSIHDQPMCWQKDKLERHLQQWMEAGYPQQVDDIMVLGMRFG